MSTLTLDDAKTRLPEIIAGLSPGQLVLILDRGLPVAQLQAVPAKKRQPLFGSCKGMVTILAEDDEHLEDFKDYLP